MRIAQVAPLWEKVPPPAYGGIELVVGLLTDELVRRGHEVVLFASGDSESLAPIESVHPCAIRTDPAVKEYSIYEALQLSRVYQAAADFDIIHSHMGCAALPYAGLVKTPTLHTLHGIFTPDNHKLFTQAKRQPFVSISRAQQQPCPHLNYISTVYNGIDVNRFEFYPQPDAPPYLAFLGRMAPEKGPHLAIAIAKQAGLQLKLAGKVDPIEQAYFNEMVLPHVDGQQIQYLGEANHQQKNILMGRALATLFPITWPEPFGLVMTESMATGTPVIALTMGSAPEIVAHGRTGFLCNSVAECVQALTRVPELNRQACREHVQHRFSVEQMVSGYEVAYQQVLCERFSYNGHHYRSADLVA